jgi:hypothetical protein
MAYSPPVGSREIAMSDPDKPKLATPAVGPRPDGGKMTATELQQIMGQLVDAAEQYVDLEISPARATATEYYQGKPFGNEKKGRSAMVITEVHDGVQAVLPHMLRALSSDAERVVEFVPRRADSEDAAAQAMDYLNMVFMDENDGFIKMRNVILDGLVRKHGIFKWWWDDTPSTSTLKMDGLSQAQIEVLAAEKDVTLNEVSPMKEYEGPEPLFEVELTRTCSYGRLRVCEVPPEELIANREARTRDDFIFFGHRTRKTTGELLQMGVSQSDIDEHGGDDMQIKMDPLAVARNPLDSANDETDSGESNTRHLYIEGYTRIDFNGDGKSELRKICLLGPSHYPVSNEAVEDLNFSVWCPDPEPHSLLGGRSWADRLMDLQRLKSQLMRSLLDSASAAIFPRTWYREGDANLADILNQSIGAPIRTRSGPNAVGEFSHTFMGKELIPVLEMTNDIVERRTGIAKGAAGMDADALQSSTRSAVAAAITATQAAQELLVRMFAEMALKPMFKGMLKLAAQYQRPARLVRLRGQFVTIDPRLWDADMDVTVNVALGAGLIEDKIQTLMEISAKQGEILQNYGQNNPVVTIKQYADTLAEIALLRGKKNTQKYFNQISDAQMQQMQRAAQNAPPPPNPEMEKVKGQMQLEQFKAQAAIASDQAKSQHAAQLEQAKAQIEVEREAREAEQKMILEQHKAALEREKAQMEDARERARIEADINLRILELQLKYNADLSKVQVSAQVDREKMALEAHVAGAKIDSTERVADAKNQTTERVAKSKAAAPKKDSK